ncbi:hypothetical protein ACFSUD_17220 [Sulfitobacter aestuarii]|uniref:Uncharacterized protein n=1 Tax=Sulfitobacter aestuarii TaxID=2161676 RepID=A0ABW5U661_9RHOB
MSFDDQIDLSALVGVSTIELGNEDAGTGGPIGPLGGGGPYDRRSPAGKERAARQAERDRKIRAGLKAREAWTDDQFLEEDRLLATQIEQMLAERAACRAAV